MTAPNAYDWLLNTHAANRGDLQDHEQWFFGEWQPSMRKKLTANSLAKLSDEGFADILLDWDRNRWRGVARLKGRLANPEAWGPVRMALIGLADNRRSLGARLDELRPAEGAPLVPHLSQAVITAFLHLHSPRRYCVWNGTTEAGLQALGLWPHFDRGMTFAEKYMFINSIVNRCARRTRLSLPVLDVLWYYAAETFREAKLPEEADPGGLEGGDRQPYLRTKRNATIVRKAKLRWSDGGTVSPACAVCGWSMDEVYGDAGFGVIHAHHDVAIGSSTAARVTRISDLVPVCPSCHAVLHSSGLSVSELRKRVVDRGMAYA